MAFAAETDVIREVGTVDLPNLAETLRTVSNSVVESEENWAKAFREDRTPTMSMYEETARVWGAACDSFYYLLRESATRIDRAADALVVIADNYENADAVAAAGLFEIDVEPS
jgi:hypothetical protein